MNDRYEPWGYNPFIRALERVENWIAVKHAAEQQVDPEKSEPVLKRLMDVCYTDDRSAAN